MFSFYNFPLLKLLFLFFIRILFGKFFSHFCYRCFDTIADLTNKFLRLYWRQNSISVQKLKKNSFFNWNGVGPKQILYMNLRFHSVFMSVFFHIYFLKTASFALLLAINMNLNWNSNWWNGVSFIRIYL